MNVTVSIDDVADRYERRRRLGAGAFGDVYVYYDRRFDREVAVKFCSAARPILDIDEEGRRLAQLDHPNIVSVFDLLQADDSTYGLVMQLVRGELLRDAVRPGLRRRLVRRWVDSLASGLAEAHHHSLVHCDLHPGNVIVRDSSDGGSPMIFDFGVSTIVGERRTIAAAHPLYRAPEFPHDVQPASDFWSLGLIATQLATGTSLEAILADAGVHSGRLSATDIGMAVRGRLCELEDQGLAGLIERLLAEDPRQRANREEVFARIGLRLKDTITEEGFAMGLASAAVRGHHGEVWRVTPRHRVEHRWFENGRWSEWHDFTFERPALDVAAVSGWREHIEVFVLDRNGTVWHRWWWKDSGWHPRFEDLGRPFGTIATRGISAFSAQDGHMDVLVEAEDGRIANMWFEDGRGWRGCDDASSLGDGWWPFSR